MHMKETMQNYRNIVDQSVRLLEFSGALRPGMLQKSQLLQQQILIIVRAAKLLLANHQISR